MPPLFGSSGYGPGTSYTTTGGVDYGPAQMAQALLAREGDFLSRRAAASAPVGRRMAPAGMGAATPEAVTITRRAPEKSQLERARERDELLQMQARQNPAPMKGLTGFNMIGSAGGMDVMDTNAMNAHQREAYLPNGAGFTPTSYTASQALTHDRGEWDPYIGRRMEGPGVALGPGADFARAQMANAARR